MKRWGRAANEDQTDLSLCTSPAETQADTAPEVFLREWFSGVSVSKRGRLATVSS